MEQEILKIVDEEFPHLDKGIFLNAAHVVIPPKSVLQAYNSFTEKYVENLAKGVVDDAWGIVEQARSDVAALINADKDEIGFVKNTAEAIGIIASGFPFSKNDNVILCDQEHPSNLFPWISLHEQKGVELKIVKNETLDISESEFIDAADENTKAIVISAVQFTTGVFTTLREIGAFCRKNNILFIVDGIQAIGRMKIDVRKMNIDYLGCGSNKGLLSMLGAGFVYCRKELVPKIIPPYVGYQSVDNFISPPALTSNFEKIFWKNDARRFEAGNLNYAGIAAIQAGVQLLNKIGIENIQKRVLDLQKNFIDLVSDLSIPWRTPISNVQHWSGILCAYYDEENEEKVKEVLHRNKLILTMRGGYMRIALNFYNKEEHIDQLYLAFKEIYS